jgi:hypothetical protein
VTSYVAPMFDEYKARLQPLSERIQQLWGQL